MIVPFLVFVVLLGWSLYDGDLYPKEGAIFVGVWVISLLILLLLRVNSIWLVVPTVLLDIVLILKVFGQDIQIR